jgi:hypothetical protein
MVMPVGECIEIFNKIFNEFHILNEYFSSIFRSTTADYDAIFSNWSRDMIKRFNQFPLSMHWATSSRFIANNQLLFNVRHSDDYLCEVKYKFDPKFIKLFPGNIKKYMDNCYEVDKNFIASCDAYDRDKMPNTSDFEKYFLDWKKGIYLKDPGVVLDIRWSNNLESVVLNPVYLAVMLQDDCNFEAKYLFVENSTEEMEI